MCHIHSGSIIKRVFPKAQTKPGLARGSRPTLAHGASGNVSPKHQARPRPCEQHQRAAPEGTAGWQQGGRAPGPGGGCQPASAGSVSLGPYLPGTPPASAGKRSHLVLPRGPRHHGCRGAGLGGHRHPPAVVARWAPAHTPTLSSWRGPCPPSPPPGVPCSLALQLWDPRDLPKLLFHQLPPLPQPNPRRPHLRSGAS